jgi:hypothetical protein
MIAYTLQAPALPFPVFALSYAINGIGMALQVCVLPFFRLKYIYSYLISNSKDAQANGYVATLKDNAETKMGILHAAYGMYTTDPKTYSLQYISTYSYSSRRRCLSVPPYRHPIRPTPPLVIPLPRVPRCRDV